MIKQVFVSDDDILSIRHDVSVPEMDKHELVHFLHDRFLSAYPEKKILEVSTRGNKEEGKALSAFNLCYTLKKSGQRISVESAYQGSKVFTDGSTYPELFSKNPYTAKMDKRLWGKQIAFYLFYKQRFEVYPPTLFYNWLYLKTLQVNPQVWDTIKEYDAYTDTAGDMNRSINCQARACAIAHSLFKLGLFEVALENLDNFKKIVCNHEEPVLNFKYDNQYSLLSL